MNNFLHIHSHHKQYVEYHNQPNEEILASIAGSLQKRKRHLVLSFFQVCKDSFVTFNLYFNGAGERSNRKNLNCQDNFNVYLFTNIIIYKDIEFVLPNHLQFF